MYNCEIFPGCENEYDEKERFFIPTTYNFLKELPKMTEGLLSSNRYVVEYFYKKFKNNPKKITKYFKKNFEKYTYENMISKCGFVLYDEDTKTKFTNEIKIMLSYSLTFLLMEGLLNGLFYDFKNFTKVFESFNSFLLSLNSDKYYITQDIDLVKNNIFSKDNKKPVYVETMINEFGSEVYYIYFGDEEFTNYIKNSSFVSITPMKKRFDKFLYFGVENAFDIYVEDDSEYTNSNRLNSFKNRFGDDMYESVKNKNYEFIEIVLEYPIHNYTVVIRPAKTFYTNVYNNILYMKNKKSKYSFIDINDINKLFLPIYGSNFRNTVFVEIDKFNKEKYGIETFIQLLDRRVARNMNNEKYHIYENKAVFKRVYRDNNNSLLARFDCLNSLNEIDVKHTEIMENTFDPYDFIVNEIFEKNRKIIDYLNRY